MTDLNDAIQEMKRLIAEIGQIPTTLLCNSNDAMSIGAYVEVSRREVGLSPFEGLRVVGNDMIPKGKMIVLDQHGKPIKKEGKPSSEEPCDG